MGHIQQQQKMDRVPHNKDQNQFLECFLLRSTAQLTKGESVCVRGGVDADQLCITEKSSEIQIKP